MPKDVERIRLRNKRRFLARRRNRFIVKHGYDVFFAERWMPRVLGELKKDLATVNEVRGRKRRSRGLSKH